jgi:hypothetical protein
VEFHLALAAREEPTTSCGAGTVFLDPRLETPTIESGSWGACFRVLDRVFQGWRRPRLE